MFVYHHGGLDAKLFIITCINSFVVKTHKSCVKKYWNVCSYIIMGGWMQNSLL